MASRGARNSAVVVERLSQAPGFSRGVALALGPHSALDDSADRMANLIGKFAQV
jgi:hypothetical protein